MKRYIAGAAALALLSACGENAEETETGMTAGESAMVEDASGVRAVRAQDLVGTWTYTWPEGTAGTSSLNADGTYTREMEDGSTFTGAWELDGEEACFTDEGAVESRCYTIGAAAPDGSRVLTRSDGEEMTIHPST